MSPNNSALTLVENWSWRTEWRLDPNSAFPIDPGELKIDVDKVDDADDAGSPASLLIT